MARHTRRLAVRARLLLGCALLSWAIHHRWRLRPGAVRALTQPVIPPQTREQHWQRLCRQGNTNETESLPHSSSTHTDSSADTEADRLAHHRSRDEVPLGQQLTHDSVQNALNTDVHSSSSSLSSYSSSSLSSSLPVYWTNSETLFDVLIVGGGLTGLYAAVDGAQRGLRVALVERADVASGSSGCVPCVVPGALPYVQRALRQRDASWLTRAWTVLRCATVWRNVAPWCVADPDEGDMTCTYAQSHEQGDDCRDAKERSYNHVPMSRVKDCYTCSSPTVTYKDAVTGVQDAHTMSLKTATSYRTLHGDANSYKDVADATSTQSAEFISHMLLPSQHVHSDKDVSPAHLWHRLYSWLQPPVKDRLWTCIPIHNRSEWLELACAATLSSGLSLLTGGSLRCCPRLSAASVSGALPALPERPHGAVLSCDSRLDGCAAAVSLARTAEALGVTLLTYAPLTGIEAGRVVASSVPRELNGQDGETVVVATIADALDTTAADTIAADATQLLSQPNLCGRRARVYARALLNCSGGAVHAVRTMTQPQSAATGHSAALAEAGVMDYCYLVAPRAALYTHRTSTTRPACVGVKEEFVPTEEKTGIPHSHDAGATAASSNPHTSASRTPAACVSLAPSTPSPSPHDCNRHDTYDDRLFSRLPRPATGVQLSTLRHRFASLSILPWYDDCVLIGPHRRFMAADSATESAASTARHESQQHDARRYLREALAECGLRVWPPESVLSHVTYRVPLLDLPDATSLSSASISTSAWDMMYDGFHVSSNKTAPHIVVVFFSSVLQLLGIVRVQYGTCRRAAGGARVRRHGDTRTRCGGGGHRCGAEPNRLDSAVAKGAAARVWHTKARPATTCLPVVSNM